MDEKDTAESAAGEVKPRGKAGDRWRAIVAQQRESGLGVSAFCRGRSIPTSSFYGWRQKLFGPPRRAKAGAGGAGSDWGAAFVPVRLAGSISSATVPELAERGEAPLEVRLRGGRRLLVRDFFHRGLLVELVGVLEGMA